MIRKLIKIANHLDQIGLYKMASEIDYILRVYAMNRDEARKILGLSGNESSEEIGRSYKNKALLHHPDIGGDKIKMQEINIARDILMKNVSSGPAYEDPDVDNQSEESTDISDDEDVQGSWHEGWVTISNRRLSREIKKTVMFDAKVLRDRKMFIVGMNNGAVKGNVNIKIYFNEGYVAFNVSIFYMYEDGRWSGTRNIATLMHEYGGKYDENVEDLVKTRAYEVIGELISETHDRLKDI